MDGKRLSIVTLLSVMIMMNVVNTSGFTYYEGSIFEEITTAHFDLNLEEGSHVLVLDNTGYTSDNFDPENRETANVEFEISFFGGDVDSIKDTQTLVSGEYYHYQFDFQADLFVNVEKIVFDISSNEKISLFVTSPSNYNGWENELQDLNEEDTPFPFITLIVSFTVIGLLNKLSKSDFDHFVDHR